MTNVSHDLQTYNPAQAVSRTTQRRSHAPLRPVQMFRYGLKQDKQNSQRSPLPLSFKNVNWNFVVIMSSLHHIVKETGLDCEKQSQFCIASHNQEEKPTENVHSSINVWH